MTIEKKAEGCIGELVGALCDPIIVYPSPWKDDLPDWVKPQITLERLVMNMQVMHEGGVPVGDTAEVAIRAEDNPFRRKYLDMTLLHTIAPHLAKLTIARDMLATMWAMWRKGEKYNPEIREKAANQQI